MKNSPQRSIDLSIQPARNGKRIRSVPLNNEDRNRARNYRHFERAKLPSPAINQLATDPPGLLLSCIDREHSQIRDFDVIIGKRNREGGNALFRL